MSRPERNDGAIATMVQRAFVDVLKERPELADEYAEYAKATAAGWSQLRQAIAMWRVGIVLRPDAATLRAVYRALDKMKTAGLIA